MSIRPKNEWKTLTSYQLLDVKTELTNLYFNMRGINASFANQYAGLLRELDMLIALKEAAERAERDKDEPQLTMSTSISDKMLI